MAGDWIKVEVSTPDKPEVVSMADELGIDQDAVFGKCLRLWIWADSQTEDGYALSVTNVFIDRITFCNGFAQALQNVGWLTVENGKLNLPNFSRHNGKSAKNRANSASRMKTKRRRDAASVTNGVTNVTQEAQPEKRREEKSNTYTLMQNSEFESSWERWKKHRSEKFKPLGEIEAESQLLELSRHPQDQAQAIVEFSIRQGALNLITNGDHHAPSRKRSRKAMEDFIPRD